MQVQKRQTNEWGGGVPPATSIDVARAYTSSYHIALLGGGGDEKNVRSEVSK